jgi:hypothetical protein
VRNQGLTRRDVHALLRHGRPGREGGAVGSLADRAVAVRDPVERPGGLEADATAQTTAGGDLLVHARAGASSARHLIVEAHGKHALGSGMKSISARVARAAQRVFSWQGRVLDGRYHLRLLKTPREVRNALAYVLLNVRKHWRQRNGQAPPVQLDEASSGRWFDGWKLLPRGPDDAGVREVAPARTWLLTRGWRRHGLVDPGEVPGGRPTAALGTVREQPEVVC